MKEIRDKFSKQTSTYKNIRPTYPQELYDEILELAPEKDASWDRGTGNGQVAKELSRHFKKVFATDINEIKLKREHCIELHWTMDELKGFLNSWSSVQNFIVKEGKNPVIDVIERIRPHWKNRVAKEIKFPIFTRIGRIEK